MRYLLALMIFVMTATNAMAAGTQVSFQGVITKAVCTITTADGNIHSSCVKNHQHHVASFHVSSAEGQHFSLPGNIGQMHVKWLNDARTKGLLITHYR